MSPQAPLPAATFVYKSDPVRGRQWAEVFRAQAPEIDFRIWPDMGDPAKVRFLAAWEPPENISECFPNLQVLFSSGAGVDQFNFAALATGQLSEAVLDVTDPEPLPTAHPLWRHPQVQITPHIASMTQPLSAAAVVIDNLHRFHAGQPMTGLVDRARGY